MTDPSPYICPGCMVREPWEHRCCRDEENGRMCECKECRNTTNMTNPTAINSVNHPFETLKRRAQTGQLGSHLTQREARELLAAVEALRERAEPTPGHIEAAVHAYCREAVLTRQRRRADRGELHPGDIGLDIDGDIQVSMRLMNRDAMKAALEATDPDTAVETLHDRARARDELETVCRNILPYIVTDIRSKTALENVLSKLDALDQGDGT